MFISAAVLISLFPTFFAQKERTPPPPEGLFALQCIVVKVHGDVVEVEIEEAPAEFRRSRQKLKISKDSRLEQLLSGKPVTKTIALEDLRPEQAISVIVHFDGKEATLLRAVASAPRANVVEFALHIGKLGGKLKRRTDFNKRTVYEVDLRATRTTDADVKLLGQAKRLTYLDLSFTAVSDRGIANLVPAVDLETLNLAGTKATDAAVLQLRRLPNLRSVDLSQTAVTAAGFNELVRLKTIDIVRVGLGANAHFRVHQRYNEGELEHNFLMIGDTHFGTYLAGRRSGGILHEQPGSRRRLAATYYHRKGPVGR